jgi:hypothetical protein
MQVAGTTRFRTWALIVPMFALTAGLSGCGRDTSVAEQVMEAKQAAQRAEAAQAGAEQALARLTKQQSPVADAVPVEQEPVENEPGDDVRPDNDTEADNSDS